MALCIHKRLSQHLLLAAVAICPALCLLPTAHLYAQTSDTPVQLVLSSKIDSKSAKVGDKVVTKTVSNKIEVGGVAIPSGSKLVGKITSSTHQPASVSIEFDSLERKGQPAIPVQASLVAVGPPPQDDSALPLPSGKSGYTNTANPVSSKDSDSASTLTGTGSSIKNVTLEKDTLTSSKDFKLNSGSRITVTLTATAKQ